MAPMITALLSATKPRLAIRVGQPSDDEGFVQLHLDGRRVMRSLQTRDIEVAHRRAAQAMAELEAEHKADQLD